MGTCRICKKTFPWSGTICEDCALDLPINREIERNEKLAKDDWKKLTREEQKRIMNEKRYNKEFWLDK